MSRERNMNLGSLPGFSEEDEAAQRLFQRWTEDGAHGENCPDSAQLWDAANALIAGEALVALTDHVSGCASCASDWAVALTVRDDASGEAYGAISLAPAGLLEAPVPAKPDPGRPQLRVVRSPSRSLVTMGGLALAAAALLALVNGLPFAADEAPPTYRADANRISLTTPANAVLDRNAVTLSWEAEAGWTYDVILTDDELREVHRIMEVTAGRVEIPPAVFEDLPADTVLMWRVQAVSSTGETRSSRTEVIRLP